MTLSLVVISGHTLYSILVVERKPSEKRLWKQIFFLIIKYSDIDSRYKTYEENTYVRIIH